MGHRTLKLGFAGVLVAGAILPLALFAQPASADYTPNAGDVVGVGSDTLQYMIDFMAGGDAYGDTGYNQLNNKYKLVNIDATADFNARLAYGVNGGQAGQPNCTPGTGSTSGTGNATSTNTGIPCVLNPTVVLRSGLQAVQRPNGSGAGAKALVQDIIAGHNTPATEVINYARASACQFQNSTCTALSGAPNPVSSLPSGQSLDQLTVATDTLPILTSTSAGGGVATHDLWPLSASELSIIYSQNSGNCITWSDPRISGVILENASVSSSSATITFPAADGQVPSADDGWVAEQLTTTSGALNVGTDIPSNDTVVSTGTNSITLNTMPSNSGTDIVALVNPSASTKAIIPLVPQVGSGTRSFFLGQLVPSLSSPGTCTAVSEENDPTAVYDVASGLSLDPADAIEPMSQGRLDLYQGNSNTGTAEGIGGYFLDPSCAYLAGTSACGSGSVSGGTDTYTPNAVSPAVATIQTGHPVGLGVYNGTGQGGGLFDPTRTLYLYFRNSDITSTTPWQPGTSENWLNTLFYDPCQFGQTCTGPGGIYGPAGAPYIQSAEGQTLLEDAGVTPVATEQCTQLPSYSAC